MKCTTIVYNQMIEDCKEIAIEFKRAVATERESLDPLNNEDDMEKMEVSADSLNDLFEKFKVVMGLNCKLDFFRDNDEEYGRYSEHNNAVYLPYCIGMDKENAIVEHMAHELYHAFQYAAICSPASYPCFDTDTIRHWEYEFHNYGSGAKDIRQYLGQEIEKTAKEFGKLIGGA
ncbi:hypothetical protein L6472_09980 [Prevotella sp. E13-17]|uniref:hypothetical protein n=1 Tax=Prevotella sp. E13-17 TaxID=2913616 RepID=UPI001EDB5721|nr:hypothetical protein [Prevotella sp. E13-17]UKK50348.1 hypothetical protein L6472_09980 [Prevotella sp. E13-17]